MDDYKHYIRVENGIIIHGFSSAFEQPITGDIQLLGEFGRHFQQVLLTDRGQYKYKLVNSQMVERTQSELNAEWSERPPTPPTADQRLSDLEMALADIFANGGV